MRVLAYLAFMQPATLSTGHIIGASLVNLSAIIGCTLYGEKRGHPWLGFFAGFFVIGPVLGGLYVLAVLPQGALAYTAPNNGPTNAPMAPVPPAERAQAT